MFTFWAQISVLNGRDEDMVEAVLFDVWRQ